MSKPILWLDRYPVGNKDDLPGLERDAAIGEFHDRLDREQAEAKAYEKYKKSMHARAAAHHLRGSRAAQGAGSMEDARKHGLLYSAHVRAMGLNPLEAVPREVLAHASPDEDTLYSFRAHPSDAWLLQG